MWELNTFMEMQLPNSIYQMTLFPLLLVANAVMETTERFALLISTALCLYILNTSEHSTICVYSTNELLLRLRKASQPTPITQMETA